MEQILKLDLEIKKFKDALAKHGPDRCSLGPPKGLEEKEQFALSANKDLSFVVYKPKPEQPTPVPVQEEILAEAAAAPPPPPSSHPHSEPLLPLPLLLPSTTPKKDTQDRRQNWSPLEDD